ncbi:EAL domain-containing protein [Sporosarcina sp. 179-K 3D1 HS]|uniref:EAL domain-containing protein n=1 Tax=Sporosarcina sp. 179-K 3D1 HS TaxID=3232169 RepID=UPI0039A1703E
METNQRSARMDRFFQGIPNKREKQVAASKILDAALEVGAIPLAEGVEEWEDFQWHKNKGFQLFQGYLFGKPSPIIG